MIMFAHVAVQKAIALFSLLLYKDPTILLLAALDVWAICYGISWVLHKVRRSIHYTVVKNSYRS